MTLGSSRGYYDLTAVDGSMLRSIANDMIELVAHVACIVSMSRMHKEVTRKH
jgi:hypothetical protein